MQGKPYIGFFHDFTITDLRKPYWASGPANGKYVLGAVLPTRDGRRTGNAKIMAICGVDYADGTPSQTNYLVKTDGGNSLWLSGSELEELFYPPEWVAYIAKRQTHDDDLRAALFSGLFGKPLQ